MHRVQCLALVRHCLLSRLQAQSDDLSAIHTSRPVWLPDVCLAAPVQHWVKGLEDKGLEATGRRVGRAFPWRIVGRAFHTISDL